MLGWGGTYGHIASAIHDLQEEGVPVAYTHFDYINPLPPNTAEVFSHYKKFLVCELNSGQFASYLQGLYPQFTFRKYGKVQGQPFLVSELIEAIKKEM